MNKNKIIRLETDSKMPDFVFKVMSLGLKTRDMFFSLDKWIKSFDIKEGMTIIDYGCGIGSYLKTVSELVGDTGKLYAVDIHNLAIDSAERIKKEHKLVNLETVLLENNACSLDSDIADMIYAMDMFHIVKSVDKFLQELHRLTKKDGVLILDPGHQFVKKAEEKVMKSGCWKIDSKIGKLLRCKPITSRS